MYRYLEDVATADIAFEAEGESLEQLFRLCADATTNVMVENLDAVLPMERRTVDLENDELDMLLFDLLQELVYYKDAERLLLRVKDAAVSERDGKYRLHAVAAGERMDPERHDLAADVKAVTLHRFSLKKSDSVWKAFVILDI